MLGVANDIGENVGLLPGMVCKSATNSHLGLSSSSVLLLAFWVMVFSGLLSAVLFNPCLTGVFNAKFEVEKFDGTNNFGMWQCEVMDVLYQQELDIALEDKPNDMGEKQWTRINRQACSTIRLCLAKDQKYFVMKETSAKALWQKLDDKYKNVKNRLYLKMQLFSFQFKRGISMIEHLDSFNKIIADLLNLDVEINDEDKTLLLLNSLPDTYDHLTTTLLHGKDKINFVDVSNALVNNECHLFGEEPGLSLPYQAHRRPKSGSIMFEK